MQSSPEQTGAAHMSHLATPPGHVLPAAVSSLHLPMEKINVKDCRRAALCERAAVLAPVAGAGGSATTRRTATMRPPGRGDAAFSDRCTWGNGLCMRSCRGGQRSVHVPLCPTPSQSRRRQGLALACLLVLPAWFQHISGTGEQGGSFRTRGHIALLIRPMVVSALGFAPGTAMSPRSQAGLLLQHD